MVAMLESMMADLREHVMVDTWADQRASQLAVWKAPKTAALWVGQKVLMKAAGSVDCWAASRVVLKAQ